VILLEWVTQGDIAVYFVAISPTFLDAGDIPSIDKVTNDRLGGALGNADKFSDVSGPQVGIAGEADQDVTVIGEKRPIRLLYIAHPSSFLQLLFTGIVSIDGHSSALLLPVAKKSRLFSINLRNLLPVSEFV
jgi:hypothetical protein